MQEKRNKERFTILSLSFFLELEQKGAHHNTNKHKKRENSEGRR
jgi:hypothetical protein